MINLLKSAIFGYLANCSYNSPTSCPRVQHSECLDKMKESSLTSYLTLDKQQDICNRIRRLGNETCRDITGFWDGKTELPGSIQNVSAELWPYCGLKALHEGFISENQVATISLIAQAKLEFYESSFDVAGHKENCEIIPVSREAFFNFSIYSPGSEDYEKYLNIFFSNWNITNFRREIGCIESLLEKSFFVIEAPKTPLHNWGRPYEIIRKITYQDSLTKDCYPLYPFEEELMESYKNPSKDLDPYKHANKRKLILPSFSLLQAFTRNVNKLPIDLFPRFGTFTINDMINDRYHYGHICNLHISSNPLPDKADDVIQNRLGFSWHDFYHTFRYSSLSFYQFLGVNRILQVLTKHQTEEAIAVPEKLLSFLTDFEFRELYSGDLFLFLRKRCNLDSYWENLILKDMATHIVFWDVILNKTLGFENNLLKDYRLSTPSLSLPHDQLRELFPLLSDLLFYNNPYLDCMTEEEIINFSNALHSKSVKNRQLILNELTLLLERFSEEEIKEKTSWKTIMEALLSSYQ